MNLNIKRIFILLFTFLYMHSSYARFQTQNDASISYDLYNRDLSIDKNGHYEEIIEFKITLLREQARGFAAKFPITYNADSEKIELIEAKTILNGEEYPITSAMMEDKEIANNLPGFDAQRELALSFPRPEVGATIYLKYKINTYNIPVDKEFFDIYRWGTGGYWKQAKLTINSELPLKIKTNDPYKKLLVKTDPITDNLKYFSKAEVTLRSPLINDVINEPANSILAKEKQTYISLTSLDNWQKIGNDLTTKYNAVLEQPLPTLFLDIIDIASKATTPVDQINMVTKMLNEKVEYFGDWRSINGKFIPQDFTKVATKQSGDCKDFSTITVKILRELGYKANVALVRRGAGYQSTPDILPTMWAFNHAMVRAVDKTGKIYWIDPTNNTSMADGIFPDIAEKHSLILDQENSNYEQISAISKEHAKILITNIISSDKIIDTKIEFLGEEATLLTAAELYSSKENLQDWIYNNMVSGNIIEANRISLRIQPNLTSRIVKPITISLKYKNPNIFSKTNLGSAYSLTSFRSLQNIINVDIEKDLNDLYMNAPRTLACKTTIKDAHSTDLAKLDFTIDTPFVSLSRQCYAKDNDIIIEEKAIIHQSWIKNDDIKSKEFKELQNIIQENLVNPLVVLRAKEDLDAEQ